MDRRDSLAAAAEISDLYKFHVPLVLSEDGLVCARELDPKKFDLGLEIYGIPDDSTVRLHHPMTARLQSLRRSLIQLQERVGADWIGIYRKMRGVGPQKEEETLVKECYLGAPSRVFFPIRPMLAYSTNARVASHRKTHVIDNTAAAEAYYQCDARVLSECCVPVIDKSGDLLGIVDAESFQKYYFHPERVHTLETFAQELAVSGLMTV